MAEPTPQQRANKARLLDVWAQIAALPEPAAPKKDSNR